MSRTALSRITTYSTLTTNVRNESRVTTSGYSLMTDAYVRDISKLCVQRWAKILTDAEKPFYRDKENLTVSGSANPYYADTSSLNPYWNKSVRLVHVTSGGTRTPINVGYPETAEEVAKLENVQANSINAMQLGWGFRIFFGSALTVTTGTDVIEFTFDSQAIASNATGDYLDVPDSIVPYVKEEVVDYLLKYSGLMDSSTFHQRQSERYKRALNA